MLETKGLNAWYGASHILHGISLTVERGAIVALVGRNGAGKTTTIRSIMGLMPKTSGDIRFDGVDLTALRAHQRFGLGLAYVPEERRIVPGLTVRENLQLGLVASRAAIDERRAIDEIADSFPRLKERLGQEAVTMSGGEQQMLAIARAMIAKPKMILLDEPSEGIMPVLVEEMGALFRRLRDAGVTLLLVEQNVEWALRLADRAVIIDQGEVVHESSAAALLADKAMQERYCAV
ncbi:ABC transporter ATP-binding protein [Bradyrhizobium sp. U87765 SZCCT0131]|uniref:ABC transporter ATP-binding protein n=1 Tax=unclassified Bradyrhizobium TaxID=2631580 RepID=UPI001BA73FE6|nr:MULTISPECIES: ABC transporter ATP-binding protein [unclassified Bradyrhizobium]MBR1222408.1 ABC transporter ATP-binding protein [Bradyrhizobium sp. U87765 SZCCT0131]MBR1264108.1 ABC transporter ATP-binding protein [Bradyrhizobium sp. U87765 SZCCT0134]MBR1308109.1 ABC transporter ATP-binding protein [Bradyrhizobium sp. U87765 SZCCT0110]MBR1320358.1 ABC transporter ATP-binding protein [Bradyrhizobium sp. U87765 SZCCT0109]MBR1348529.1 ABC transporter ATP-binding protein [Bradyrhizobium sp. U87